MPCRKAATARRNRHAVVWVVYSVDWAVGTNNNTNNLVTTRMPTPIWCVSATTIHHSLKTMTGVAKTVPRAVLVPKYVAASLPATTNNAATARLPILNTIGKVPTHFDTPRMVRPLVVSAAREERRRGLKSLNPKVPPRQRDGPRHRILT